MDEPKDLGIKIVSKEEKLWIEIKERAETTLRTGEAEKKINLAVIKLCEKELYMIKQKAL